MKRSRLTVLLLSAAMLVVTVPSMAMAAGDGNDAGDEDVIISPKQVSMEILLRNLHHDSSGQEKITDLQW